jgi:hypothetical protein
VKEATGERDAVGADQDPCLERVKTAAEGQVDLMNLG